MLDHLVLGTPDLDVTVARLAACGIVTAPGGRHVGRGTRNHLAGLGGGAYLEVIGPDTDQPEPAQPRPFGLDDLTTEALLTWAVRVDDIDAAVAAARAVGHDPGDPAAMERDRPDGVRLAWRLTAVPAPGLGGLVPFLIDWGSSPHPSASAPRGARLVGLRATHPDPAAVTAWLDALGVVDEMDVAEGPRSLRASVETSSGSIDLS